MEVSTNDGSGIVAVHWMTHKEVAQHLRVDTRKLRRAMGMRATTKPWVDVGSEKRPIYRWRRDGVDAWWADVHQRGEVPPQSLTPGRRRRSFGGTGRG